MQSALTRATMTKLAIIVIVIVIFLQVVVAKKHKRVTTLEKATAKISSFLENAREFFQDVIDLVADLVGYKPKKRKGNKKDDWSEDMVKYTTNIFKSGYKVIKNAIPILDMARSTMDEVGPILPKVTAARFVASLLNQVVPNLMNRHHTDVVLEK